MNRPLIHGDLVDAAAALLLCQDAPLVEASTQDEGTVYESEPLLADARVAASAYLVTCFTYASTAGSDDADEENDF